MISRIFAISSQVNEEAATPQQNAFIACTISR